MKLYAVIDTNVLVSALLSKHTDSATVQVLDSIVSNNVIPLFNMEILSEYQTVLGRAKFPFTADDISLVLSYITENGIECSRTYCDETFPDPKDIVFYEVALSKEDSFLVTGNAKHFPAKPIVVTPAEFIKIIASVSAK